MRGNKFNFMFLLLLVMIIALGGLLVNLPQRQDIRNRATGCGVNSYITPNPVNPGGNFSVAMTSDQGLTYINIDFGGGASCQTDWTSHKCSGNPLDNKQCWWRWNCVATNVLGTYPVNFSNLQNCNVSVNYVVGTISPTATLTPIPTNTSVITATIIPINTPTNIPTNIPANTPTVRSQPTETMIPTATKTPAPTPTPATAAKYINFKFSFNGILSDGKCINSQIKVTVVPKSGSQIVFSNVIPTLIGTSNNQVIYKASLDVSSLTATDEIALLVKGPKHITMKYGVGGQNSYYNQQDGRLKATATNPNDNIYDFSNYPLLPGDVNNDDVINGIDFAQEKVQALIHAEVNAGQEMMEDLDGSCQANNNDVNLLKLSLNEKQAQLY